MEDLEDNLNKATMDIIQLEEASDKSTRYWDVLISNWLPYISILKSEVSSVKSKINNVLQNQNQGQS